MPLLCKGPRSGPFAQQRTTTALACFYSATLAWNATAVDIRNLIAKQPAALADSFEPFSINDLTGESTSHYDMDRDGFTLLAMGFTGATALTFKLKYMAQFKAMEAELRSRPTFDPMVALNDPAAMRGLLLTYAEKAIARGEGGGHHAVTPTPSPDRTQPRLAARLGRLVTAWSPG